MHKQAAATIIFKPGVTQQEAIEALRTIKHLLDVPEFIMGLKEAAPGSERARAGYAYEEYVKRPFSGKDLVKMFNPEHGTPTFYIP